MTAIDTRSGAGGVARTEGAPQANGEQGTGGASFPPPGSAAASDDPDIQASQQRYARMSRSKWGRNQLARALTGKSYDEMTAAEKAKFDQLMDEVNNDLILFEAMLAARMSDGKSPVLPRGVRGAYVPGTGGQPGTLIIAPGQTGAQRRVTAQEEYGEAIASRARALGLDVPEGDAGARLGLAAVGRAPTRERRPDLFTAAPEDTVTLTVDGTRVTAFARRARPDGPDAALTDFLHRNAKWDNNTRNHWMSEEMLIDTFGLDPAVARAVMKKYGYRGKDGKFYLSTKGFRKMFDDGALAVRGGEMRFVPAQFLFPGKSKRYRSAGEIAEATWTLAGKKPGETMTAEEFRYYSTMVSRTIDPKRPVASMGAYAVATAAVGRGGTVNQAQAAQALNRGYVPMTGRTGAPTRADGEWVETQSALADAGYAVADLTPKEQRLLARLIAIAPAAARGDAKAIKEARKIVGELGGNGKGPLEALFAGLPGQAGNLDARDFGLINRRLKGSFRTGMRTREAADERAVQAHLMDASPDEIAAMFDMPEVKDIVAKYGASGLIDYVCGAFGVELTDKERRAFANGKMPKDPAKRKALQVASLVFARMVGRKNASPQAAQKIFSNAVAWDLGMRTSEHGVDRENNEYVYAGDRNEVDEKEDDGRTVGSEATRSYFSVGRQLYVEVFGEGAARRLDDRIEQRDYSRGGHDLINEETYTIHGHARMPASSRRRTKRVVDERYYDPNTGLLRGRYADQDWIPVELNLVVEMRVYVPGERVGRRRTPGRYETVEVEYGDTKKIKELRGQGYEITEVRQTDASQGELQAAHFRQAYIVSTENYEPRYDRNGNLVNPHPSARMAQYYRGTEFEATFNQKRGNRGSTYTVRGPMRIQQSDDAPMTDRQALRAMLRDMGLTEKQIDQVIDAVIDYVNENSDLYPEGGVAEAAATGIADAFTFGLFGLFKKLGEKFNNHPLTDFANQGLSRHGRSTWQSENRENESEDSFGEIFGQFGFDLLLDGFITVATAGLGRALKPAFAAGRAALRATRFGRAATRAASVARRAAGGSGSAVRGASSVADDAGSAAASSGRRRASADVPDVPDAAGGNSRGGITVDDDAASTAGDTASDAGRASDAASDAADAGSDAGRAASRGGTGQPGHSMRGGRQARPIWRRAASFFGGGAPDTPPSFAQRRHAWVRRGGSPEVRRFDGMAHDGFRSESEWRRALHQTSQMTDAERAAMPIEYQRALRHGASRYGETQEFVNRRLYGNAGENGTASAAPSDVGRTIDRADEANSPAAKRVKEILEGDDISKAEWEELEELLPQLTPDEALSIPFPQRKRIIEAARRHSSLPPEGDEAVQLFLTDPSTYSYGTRAMRDGTVKRANRFSRMVKQKYGARLGNWQNLSLKERKALMQEIYADFQKIPGNEGMPPLQFGPGGGGRYTPANGNQPATFTIGEDLLYDANPVGALTAISHEGAHARQYRLINGLADGTIGPGHADYDEALLYWANSGFRPADDIAQPAYLLQPVEQNAYLQGDAVGRDIAEFLGVPTTENGAAYFARGTADGAGGVAPGSFRVDRDAPGQHVRPRRADSPAPTRRPNDRGGAEGAGGAGGHSSVGARRRRGAAEDDDGTELMPRGQRRSDADPDAAGDTGGTGATVRPNRGRTAGAAGGAAGAVVVGAAGVAYYVGKDGKRKKADLTKPDELIAFLMSFDGKAGSRADGKLDAKELARANEAYFGETGRGLPQSAQQMLIRLFGSDGELTQRDLRAAVDEGVLSVDTRDGDVVAEVRGNRVTPARVRAAIWQRVAEQRGVPVSEVTSISAAELRDALAFVFPGRSMSGPVASGIVRDFGHHALRGDGEWIDAASVENVFSDKRLTIGADGTLTHRPHAQEVLGDDGDNTSPATDTPYRPARHDRGRSGAMDGMQEFGSTTENDDDAAEVERIFMPEEVFGPTNGQTGVYTPPTYQRRNGADVETGIVPRQDISRRAGPDDDTVIWTVGGVEKRVRKGSKMDRYLTDYTRFSKKDNRQHLRGRPNLEMAQSQRDPATGYTYEIWAPREHQFANRPSGQSAPIERQPILIVRDKNGKVIRPPHVNMMIGRSETTGNTVIGFQIPTPDYDSSDPGQSPVTTFFMPVDPDGSPAQHRAVANLLASHGRQVTDIGEVRMTRGDTQLAEGAGGVPLTTPQLGRRGDPGGVPLNQGDRRSIQRRVNQAWNYIREHGMDRATSDPGVRRAAMETRENGQWMHIDVAIALGLVKPSEKQSDDQFVQVTVDKETKKRMELVGLDYDPDVVIIGIPEQTPQSRRRLSAYTGEHRFTARGQRVDVQNFGFDYHPGNAEGQPNAQGKGRLQLQFRHNSFIWRGFSASAQYELRHQNNTTRQAGVMTANSVVTVTARFGYDTRVPMTGGYVRAYPFVEQSLGLQWGAGGRLGQTLNPAEQTTGVVDYTTGQAVTNVRDGFVYPTEAHVWFYHAHTGKWTWRNLVPPAARPYVGEDTAGADDPDGPVQQTWFGVDFKVLGIDWTKYSDGTTSSPDLNWSVGPMGIYVRNIGVPPQANVPADQIPGAGWRSWSAGVAGGIADFGWSSLVTGLTAWGVAAAGNRGRGAQTAVGAAASVASAVIYRGGRYLIRNANGNWVPWRARGGDGSGEAAGGTGGSVEVELPFRVIEPGSEGGGSGSAAAGSGAGSGGAGAGSAAAGAAGAGAAGASGSGGGYAVGSATYSPTFQPWRQPGDTTGTVSGEYAAYDSDGDGVVDHVSVTSGDRTVAATVDARGRVTGRASEVPPDDTRVATQEVDVDVDAQQATGVTPGTLGPGQDGVAAADGTVDVLPGGGGAESTGEAAGAPPPNPARGATFTFTAKRFTFYKPVEYEFRLNANPDDDDAASNRGGTARNPDGDYDPDDPAEVPIAAE